MFRILWYKSYKFLCNDFGILKLLMTMIFLYLVADEIYVCLVERPTLTRNVKEDLSKEDFPSLTLCPGPSVKDNEVISRGYNDIWDYKTGTKYSWNSSWVGVDVIGWNGKNKSETISEVSSEISVLKSVLDCPDSNSSLLWWARNESNKEELTFHTMEFTMEEALFPDHLCCKVKFPEAAKKNAIEGMEIGFFPEGKMFDNFRILMTDQMSSSIFEQINSYPSGDRIFTSMYEGWVNYKVKIKQEIHLENDPNYHCINYKVPGEYDQCLRKEYIKASFDILGCAPPWLTKNETLWCKENELEKKIKTDDDIYRWTTFVSDVSFGMMKSGCSVPCKKSKFYSTNGGFRGDTLKRKGVLIMFDRIVEKSISEFQRTPKTMLTRFGGLIGLGKNMLWIIILSVTGIGFFTNKTIYKR